MLVRLTNTQVLVNYRKIGEVSSIYIFNKLTLNDVRIEAAASRQRTQAETGL
jgi:hypothetical protein